MCIIGKRRYGYSRDKRSDCVRVAIALIVAPESFPLAYEVLAGNTSDQTTLADFLKRIEAQYRQARRIWVMDRGIPTEAVLEQMRAAQPQVQYLVGTSRGRLKQCDPQFGARPLKRAIQEHLLNPLATKLLAGEFKPGGQDKGQREGWGIGVREKAKRLSTKKRCQDAIPLHRGFVTGLQYPSAARLFFRGSSTSGARAVSGLCRSWHSGKCPRHDCIASALRTLQLQIFSAHVRI